MLEQFKRSHNTHKQAKSNTGFSKSFIDQKIWSISEALGTLPAMVYEVPTLGEFGLILGGWRFVDGVALWLLVSAFVMLISAGVPLVLGNYVLGPILYKISSTHFRTSLHAFHSRDRLWMLENPSQNRHDNYAREGRAGIMHGLEANMHSISFWLSDRNKLFPMVSLVLNLQQLIKCYIV